MSRSRSASLPDVSRAELSAAPDPARDIGPGSSLLTHAGREGEPGRSAAWSKRSARCLREPVMSIRKPIALTLALGLMVISGCGLAIAYSALTRPGSMERKYLIVKDDMTKGEVEAVLGQTGAMLGGG